MAGNRTICTVNDVDYISVRKAMIQGARTPQEVQALAKVCLECEGCKTQLDAILTSVCGCTGTSLEAVIQAVKGGATTVEAVGAQTGAGTVCGRCTALIQNVIDTGR